MPLVKLNANLRNIAGVKEALVNGQLLSEVITNITGRFPELADAILEEGQIRKHYLITINGHHATEINQSVNDEDVIAIFPPISGG